MQAFLTPFDLNVLGTPPAFILSQDQTLCSSVCLSFILALPCLGYACFLTVFGLHHLWCFFILITLFTYGFHLSVSVGIDFALSFVVLFSMTTSFRRSCDSFISIPHYFILVKRFFYGFSFVYNILIISVNTMYRR